MDDGFTTNRERKFYKFLSLSCWVAGGFVVAVGAWRFIVIGDKGSWKLMATGALLPFLHNLYVWFGVNIGWSIAAIHDIFRRRP